uniref:Uncharacterized protein n=1 Tax=Solanum lycopersicum TaxID=4081 RepID=A0A3Q7GJ34_SOLLC
MLLLGCIIGAGLDELEVVRQLILFVFQIIVLEGRMRVGGRVYTGNMKGENKITLGLLARQLSYTLHTIKKFSPITYLGEALKTLGKDFSVAMNHEDISLFNLHLANLEYANAGLL